MYSKIANPKTGRMVSVNGRLGKEILRNYLNVLSAGFVRPLLKRTKRALRLPAVHVDASGARKPGDCWEEKRELASLTRELESVRKMEEMLHRNNVEQQEKANPVLLEKLREEEEKRLKKWKERGVPQQLKREKIEEEREARAEERRWRAAQKHLKYQIETGNS